MGYGISDAIRRGQIKNMIGTYDKDTVFYVHDGRGNYTPAVHS